MPELPEVESVRKVLEQFVLNKKILGTIVNKPKIIAGKGNSRASLPDKSSAFVAFCQERTITAIKRRAKNIIIYLDNGTCLLTHFKMSGQLLYYQNKTDFVEQKHIHIIWQLDDGYLVYKDIRQFGYVIMVDSLHKLKADFAHYGMEPLGANFDFETFKNQLKSQSRSLKKIFLDQDIVVGLGNIYADEVSFRTRVRPTRRGKSLRNYEIQNLFEEIPKILQESINHGGTTKYTHTLPDGKQGVFTQKLQVYGRGGQPCLRCPGTLKSIKHAGRTTVYCPGCQK